MKRRNAEELRYDQELLDNPPTVIWRTLPHTGGIRVAVFVDDPLGTPGRKPRPPCECNLYGAPRRRFGPHHREDCGRYLDNAEDEDGAA